MSIEKRDIEALDRELTKSKRIVIVLAVLLGIVCGMLVALMDCGGTT